MKIRQFKNNIKIAKFMKIDKKYLKLQIILKLLTF